MSDNIHVIFESPKMTSNIIPENTMIIVGYADDGPVLKPIYIDTYDKAKKIFGSGSLAKAWLTADLAGGLDIYLMRINGSPSRATINYINGDSLSEAFVIFSKNGGYKYNENLAVEVIRDNNIANKVVLTNYNGSKTVYNLYKYPTIGQLCEAINRDSEYGLVDFTAQSSTLSPVSTTYLNVSRETLAYGCDYDPPINPVDGEYQSFQSCLQEAYDNLIDFPASIIVICGVYYGVENDYLYDLAKFCYERNYLGIPTIGIMAAKKKETLTLLEYVSELVAYTDSHSLLIDNDDNGVFVAVCSGEVQLHDGTEYYLTTLESAVGGLLTSLPNKFSTANKALAPGGSSLYLFDRSHIELLNSVGINTISNTVRKGIVCGSALTMAEPTNAFRSLKCTRVAQEIISGVTERLYEFIGNPNTVFNDIYANSIVSKYLNELVFDEYIKEYSFTITDFSSENKRMISIEFVPIGDIRKITVSIDI